MTRRPALLATLAAAVVLVMLAPAPAQTTDTSRAAALLDAAQDALRSRAYRGTVAVEWSDSQGAHSESVPVDSAGGRIELGDTYQASSGGTEQFDASTDWTLVWGAGDRESAPPVTRKYRVSVAPGVPVAGRATNVIEARTANGVVRMRAYIDVESGLILRRDIADERATRTVAFTAIDVSASDVQFPHSPLQSPRRSVPVDALPDGFVAPEQAGNGYRLMGTYRQSDGSYESFYSDGLFSVSVFQQAGDLDTKALPSGAQRVRVGETGVQRYVTAMGSVLVWERDGVVFTSLGDAPDVDVTAVATTVVRDNRSTLERVVDFLLAPLRF